MVCVWNRVHHSENTFHSFHFDGEKPFQNQNSIFRPLENEKKKSAFVSKQVKRRLKIDPLNGKACWCIKQHQKKHLFAYMEFSHMFNDDGKKKHFIWIGFAFSLYLCDLTLACPLLNGIFKLRKRWAFAFFSLSLSGLHLFILCFFLPVPRRVVTTVKDRWKNHFSKRNKKATVKATVKTTRNHQSRYPLPKTKTMRNVIICKRRKGLQIFWAHNKMILPFLCVLINFNPYMSFSFVRAEDTIRLRNGW